VKFQTRKKPKGRKEGKKYCEYFLGRSKRQSFDKKKGGKSNRGTVGKVLQEPTVGVEIQLTEGEWWLS